MTIYILSYNNYYNRQLKRELKMEAYEPYVEYTLTGVNFNPNDGVDTVHLIGVGEYDGRGDYLIVYGSDIVSRWFIIDAVRTRGGQYQLTLHRDVMADYYGDILKSPIFVEKATLEDGDPLIFNSENMTVNQIKQSEHPLKDETGCAWLVGYMSSKDIVDGEGNPTTVKSTIKYTAPADEVYDRISDYPFYKYSDKATPSEARTLYSSPTNKKICVWQQTGWVDTGKDGIYYGIKYAFNERGAQDTGIRDYIGFTRPFAYNVLPDVWDKFYQCPVSANRKMIANNSLVGPGNDPELILARFERGFVGKYDNIFSLVDSQADSMNPEVITLERGKIIYIRDTERYYKVRVVVNSKDSTEILPQYNSALWLSLKAGYDAAAADWNADPEPTYPKTWASFTGFTQAPNAYSFSINYEATTYRVILEDLPDPSDIYEVEIDNDRVHLNDAPYDMFCIPFGDDLDIKLGGQSFLTSNKELAFQTALALGREYVGAGIIYDIQLLPYCPVRECIMADGSFDLNVSNRYYIEKYTASAPEDKTTVGVVIFGTRSTFTLNITNTIPVGNKKIDACCDLWRICSPNYAGLFEFSPAKNSGVEYFNVDCTYKPYNPYIHVNPNYKGLYGYDANDARGLICGGDYSVPIATDSWSTYELQNKNYQNMFDRQIQSMEFNNNYAFLKDAVTAITGTVQGALAGGVVGSQAGYGGAGTAVGAIIGATTSFIGGYADLKINDKLRTEAVDLTQDQFGYQLGNIKALPYSLARTSAFTANNKLFPLLEHYSCTSVEKVALANKIAFNGMTVGRIGMMSEFIGNRWSYEDIDAKGYFKGKLIRFVGAGEDYHVVNTIANELNKGVYLV